MSVVGVDVVSVGFMELRVPRILEGMGGEVVMCWVVK